MRPAFKNGRPLLHGFWAFGEISLEASCPGSEIGMFLCMFPLNPTRFPPEVAVLLRRTTSDQPSEAVYRVPMTSLLGLLSQF